MSMIELSNVSKSFNDWKDRPRSIKTMMSNIVTFKFSLGSNVQKEVLRDVSFSIHKGDFVGIMGRNGAGKSTLFKIISGIYQPTSGEMKVNGSLIPLLELGAGFAMELSGYENIYLNASILGFSRKHVDKVVDDIVEFSELGENIYKNVQNYSSGMLVRLGFSIASHLESDILLFDEILAVGDIGFQRKCLKKIEELYSKGKTIVLVTHSPDQIEQYCNRCIVFDNKGVIFDGSSKDGAQKYTDLF
jgi:ABC-2 type transport system ATP-binding protein